MRKLIELEKVLNKVRHHAALNGIAELSELMDPKYQWIRYTLSLGK